MKYEYVFLPTSRHLLHADIWVDHEFGPYLLDYANTLPDSAGKGMAQTCGPVMAYGPYALELQGYRVPDTQRKADHAMFDRYFGIARVNTHISSIDMLGASCIVVMSAFLAIKQAEWSYNVEQSCGIISGIHTVLKWVLLHHEGGLTLRDHDIFRHDGGSSSRPASVPGRQDTSPAHILNRWKVGHQIFFILIQGILLCSRIIANETDSRKVERFIRELRDVLVASRFAMEFAGDMSPADYVSVVRPHMSQVSPSFSGLFLEDHAVMLIEFKKINQKIGADSRSGLVSIVSELYEAHASVCEHVTGKNQQSLMSVRRKGENLSASHDLRTKWLRRAASRFDPPDKTASCPF